MRKILYLFLLTVFSLSLTGCILKPDETKTSEEAEVMAPDISEDDSLDTIEAELDETQVENFDADLEAIDQDINQL